MKYRSAKGRNVDWTALAASSVPAEQREIQRTAFPVKQTTQRIIGGHVPKAPEPEEKPAPKAKKSKEPVVETVEEDPA